MYKDSMIKEANNEQDQKTMELQGEGVVRVVPDQAVIEVGVETINKDLTVAQRENAMVTSNVIGALLNIGIDEKDIQTTSYTINKKYDYVDGKQVDEGYVVTNIIQVTINRMSHVGEVVDIAVNNGANVVRNIQFNVKDPSFFYQEALNLALEDAIEKAISIGMQMGVQIKEIPIRIIEEYSSEVMPTGLYLTKDQYQGTPIEPGQKEIIARVKAQFTYH